MSQPDCTGAIDTCRRHDGECMDCARRDCPYTEPLHYHHDGCPACCFPTEVGMGSGWFSVPDAVFQESPDLVSGARGRISAVEAPVLTMAHQFWAEAPESKRRGRPLFLRWLALFSPEEIEARRRPGGF